MAKGAICRKYEKENYLIIIKSSNQPGPSSVQVS